MKYLTGKDYSESCKMCQDAINDAHDLIVMGFVSEEYIEDPEGPSMLAYDKGWTCIDECESEQ